MRNAAFVLAAAFAASCSGNAAAPAPLDTKTETCRSCRMPVSDASLAAQLVAPGEEPKFFDDIGCLRDFLSGKTPAAGETAYVADHRTRQWVRAPSAVYTRAALATPMGSHWIAHTSPSSRDADPAARGGADAPLREIFGPGGPP